MYGPLLDKDSGTNVFYQPLGGCEMKESYYKKLVFSDKKITPPPMSRVYRASHI